MNTTVSKPSMPLGARIADSVAAAMGSWRFIIIQSIIVALWIALNSCGWFWWKWDPAPFILLNLIFSTQAAYASPLILMSQNRQAEKDRATAQSDFATDTLAERRIEEMMRHLDKQDHAMLGILTKLNSQEALMLQLLESKPRTSRIANYMADAHILTKIMEDEPNAPK